MSSTWNPPEYTHMNKRAPMLPIDRAAAMDLITQGNAAETETGAEICYGAARRLWNRIHVGKLLAAWRQAHTAE